MAKATVISDDLFGVVVRPLLTERSTIQKEKYNQYAFEVARTADKGSIKRAVSALFKVDVVAVRTMVVPGKFRRYGNTNMTMLDAYRLEVLVNGKIKVGTSIIGNPPDSSEEMISALRAVCKLLK